MIIKAYDDIKIFNDRLREDEDFDDRSVMTFWDLEAGDEIVSAVVDSKYDSKNGGIVTPLANAIPELRVFKINTESGKYTQANCLNNNRKDHFSIILDSEIEFFMQKIYSGDNGVYSNNAYYLNGANYIMSAWNARPNEFTSIIMRYTGNRDVKYYNGLRPNNSENPDNISHIEFKTSKHSSVPILPEPTSNPNSEGDYSIPQRIDYCWISTCNTNNKNQITADHNNSSYGADYGRKSNLITNDQVNIGALLILQITKNFAGDNDQAPIRYEIIIQFIDNYDNFLVSVRRMS